MKKLVTIALLCAMLLSCFVGCGSMQVGELDVDAYAADASAQNVEFRTTLSTNADEVDVWDGSADTSWYDDDPTLTEYHISTAEQLRGLNTIMGRLASGGTCLAGVTIYLEKDLDLDGRAWNAPHSQKYFGGTIDGQGHVIANYKNTITTSGYQSFFGSISGNACIKDLSFVNATIIDKLNPTDGSESKDVVGVVVSRIKTASYKDANDKTQYKKATLSNIYTDVDFVVDEGNVKPLTKIGGLAGIVEGEGDVTIENCQNAGNIVSSGGAAAGMISYVSKAHTLTIKGCSVTGSIGVKVGSGKGNVGGLVPYINTLTGKLVIENCDVSADLYSEATYTGGLVAYTKNITGTTTIKNCNVSSDITAVKQAGGIIGNLAAGANLSKGCGAVTISGCTVSGDIVADTMSGGIIGYCDKYVQSLIIDGCKVTGSFTGHRTSGGIMGTLNLTAKGKGYITNCEVTATLDLYADDKKNNNVGGLVGKVHSNTQIENCYVAPIMTATYAPLAGDATTDDVVSGAGGLIGRVYSGVTVDIANTEVGGSYTFNHEGNDDEFLFNVGHFIGNVGEEFTLVKTNAETGEVTSTHYDAAVVNFRENNSISAGTTFTCEGIDFAKNNAGTRPVILPVGYQTRDNDNGTYDLRFVFAMQANAFPAVGAKADLGFIYGDEATFGQKVESVYAKTVYKTITDETGYVYAASDYGYSYLYTLVVTGVPADYTFEAETLQAIITPFGATKINGEVHTQNGGVMLLGDKKLNNNVAMGGFGVADLSPVLDTEKYNKNAIYVDADDFNTDLSWGVHTGVKAAVEECDGGYADGTLEIPTHVYLDSSIVVGDVRMMNITYNFEITEAGYYDMCIYFRLKGGDLNAKGDGDGSYKRGYLLSIDGAYGEEAIDFTVVEETSVADVKDASAGTYLDLWNETYFEVGTHTVTFSVGATGSYPHLRGLYFVKVAD